IPWAWALFIPVGALVFLCAFMKVGKSTFAYALAIAAAQGRSFLGYPTLQGGVLILALEEHRRDVGRRLVSFGLQRDDPVWIQSGTLKNSPTTLRSLREFINEDNIRIVIVDTLPLFWNLADENSNTEIVREVSPLLELGRESGAAVVLVHHERKIGGEEGRGIRGGSALFALVDQALTLERRRGGNDADRILKTYGRYSETPREVVITLDGTNYRLVGTSDELGTDGIDRRVLEALARGPQTRHALMRELNVSYKVIYNSLTRLAPEVLQEGTGAKGDAFTYRLRLNDLDGKT